MHKKNLKNIVIFGGAGYIGSFFTNYLLENNLVNTIYLADLTDRKKVIWPERVRRAFEGGVVKYCQVDVRAPIDCLGLPESCDLIANFAAIHREPGHEPREYYETNIYGAENVCDWANKTECGNIIFTSSIAPYGYSGEKMDEDSLTVPYTAYGGSKLAAEKIHIAWQKESKKDRYLSIVRPGVIYGPGEDGNVPRMIRAIRKGYFFYTGNKNTTKAGGYVKELVNAMYWVTEHQQSKEGNVALYNFSMLSPPTIQEYVETIRELLGIKRQIRSFPYSVILIGSYVINVIAKPLGIKHPFDPVRIKKLVFSNHIIPKYLAEEGYQYKYTLQEAFDDWMKDSPQDWGR